MDGRRILFFAAGTAWLIASPGCFWLGGKQSADAKKALLPAASVARTGESPLEFHTRLIDQPAGSDYLNRGVWDSTTSPITHQQTTLLAVNGLRIGVISSQPPTELETLASSEATSIGAMRRAGVAGQPRTIAVNGPIEKCSFGTRTTLNDEPLLGTYEEVECGLILTATASPGDKLKVRAEFTIQHGERKPWLRPTADGTGFARAEERASNRYPELTFEVTLSRSDLLLIGASDEPAGRLGQAFFYSASSDRVRQRVMLIQAGTLEK